jgi:2-pyrone-4,6-dicarboxylate lactonase
MSIPRRAPPIRTVRWLVERLKDTDNWWLMLSNGNRLSAMERGWDDAIPIARACIEAAPDRVIWASDWPHVQWRKERMIGRQPCKAAQV